MAKIPYHEEIWNNFYEGNISKFELDELCLNDKRLKKWVEYYIILRAAVIPDNQYREDFDIIKYDFLNDVITKDDLIRFCSNNEGLKNWFKFYLIKGEVFKDLSLSDLKSDNWNQEHPVRAVRHFEKEE